MLRHLSKIIFPLLCVLWVSGVLYLIPDDRLEYLKGPTEDSYWGIAQLQLQNSNVANLVIRMDTPNPPTRRDLLIALALLQSRAYMLSQRSVTTEYAFDDPVYRENITLINKYLTEIEATNFDFGDNPQISTLILNRLNDITISSQKIAAVIGVLGIRRRDALLHDINSKYSLLFYGELIVSLFFIAASGYFALAKRSALKMLEAEKNARKLEHEAAIEAEKMAATVRVFLATISHELKNPMQTLVTGLENLSAKSIAASSMRTLLNMEKAVARITTHLDEIGDFLTLGTGGLTLSFSEFYVDELLGEIIEDLHNDRSRHLPDIQIKGPSLTCVFSDRLRLKQIIYNLIDNAAKHAETSSIVVHFDIIVVDDDQSTLAITVSDYGRGISKSDLVHIFDPFYQANKRVGTGLGMGLTIAKGLTDRLHGRLTVDSQLGQGTTFTVRVPVKRRTITHHDAALSAQQPAAIGNDRFAGQKVLIVDDQESICLELSALAIALGMNADYALTAESAREACSRETYDFILCDIHLAEDDGFALADQLRGERGQDFKTRIIAISGHMNTYDYVDNPRSFDGFIGKPFTRAKLTSILNAAST
ncbi:TPA: hybrid sensor histidine kinase/response regulator [Burkholderia cenocepacia]|uniref:histidine kinase n=1 Tax=Burkholderia vietnamiensis TaxID=60552 RepID=A0ABS1AXH8_BURVI|nr:hybrid sensor histidine kinase/response regulator [Burkholderia vietnamiensis]MBJ9688836.1 response regulator [Burkholderia vietnamiensis]